MAYKRFYISAGTVLAIFIALQLYGLQIKDLTGDIYCADTCVSYFNVVNPTANSIYIYNKENIKLDFIPKIKNYELYIEYYGKWREIDFTMETRLPNVPKDRLYVFVFPRYSTKKFKLVGHKESWKDVKWSFGVKDELLDPVWLSGTQIGNYTVKELCTPIFSDISYYKACEKCYNITVNSNIKPIKIKFTVESNGTYTYLSEYCYISSCLDYIQKEQTDCNPIGKVNVSGQLVSYDDFWCKLINNKLCCIHNKEGGQFGNWKREDKSVTKWCRDLITNKEAFDNSLKVNLLEKI